MTSDPDLWMHMSSIRSKYTRAPWYQLGGRLQAGRDNVFSELDEAKHKARRAQLAPGVRHSSAPFFIRPPYLDTLFLEFSS